MSDHASSYRPDIDGLRAFAIIAVVWYHLAPASLPGGYVGVDIFFVISGYLISNLISADISANKFSLSEFYRRRIRRILPALIAVLVATQIVGAHYFLETESNEISRQVRAGALFFSNIYYLDQFGYFHETLTNSLLHLWSLGVEEQFYIFWPLLYLAILRFRRQSIVLLALLCLGSLLISVSAQPVHPRFTFYMLPCRLWELAAGALLATLAQRGVRQISNTAMECISVVGLLALTTAVIFCSEPLYQWTSLVLLVPVAGALLMIGAGPNTFLNRTFFSAPLMRFVGRISYPLYLWHWVVLWFAKYRIGPELRPQDLAWIGLTSAALAVVTFYAIEKPIQKFYRRQKNLTTAALVAALLLCALFAQYSLSHPSRVAIESRDIDGKFRQADPNSPECRAIPGFASLSFCHLSGNSKPAVAVIGDSHALQLLDGLDQVYGTSGVIGLGIYACPPYADDRYQDSDWANTRECMAHYRTIFDFIMTSPSIKIVIISTIDDGRWKWTLQNNGSKNDVANRATQIAEALNRYVKPLQKSGKRIVVFGDNPILNVDPKSCIARSWGRVSLKPVCRIAVKPAAEDRPEFYRLIDPSICVFDSWPSVADGSFVDVVQSGQALYADLTHLTIAGSLRVAEKYKSSSCFAESLR